MAAYGPLGSFVYDGDVAPILLLIDAAMAAITAESGPVAIEEWREDAFSVLVWSTLRRVAEDEADIGCGSDADSRFSVHYELPAGYNRLDVVIFNDGATHASILELKYVSLFRLDDAALGAERPGPGRDYFKRKKRFYRAIMPQIDAHPDPRDIIAIHYEWQKGARGRKGKNVAHRKTIRVGTIEPEEDGKYAEYPSALRDSTVGANLHRVMHNAIITGIAHRIVTDVSRNVRRRGPDCAADVDDLVDALADTHIEQTPRPVMPKVRAAKKHIDDYMKREEYTYHCAVMGCGTERPTRAEMLAHMAEHYVRLPRDPPNPQ